MKQRCLRFPDTSIPAEQFHPEFLHICKANLIMSDNDSAASRMIANSSGFDARLPGSPNAFEGGSSFIWWQAN